MKKFLWLIILLLTATPVMAADFFVRPVAAVGTYGNEDGSDYNNAWNGLTNPDEPTTEVQWGTGAGEVGPGDTLYVCGLHVHTVDGLGSIAVEADITPVSGTSESARVIIRGDASRVNAGYADGVLWGAYQMSYEAWTDNGNGVWYITLPGNSADEWFFEDIGSLSDSDYTILEPLTATSSTLTGTWTFTDSSTTVTADGDGNVSTGSELAAGDYVRSSTIAGTITGTWTFTNGSDTATGDGGNAASQLNAGYWIRVSDGTAWYEIASEPSANTIVFTGVFNEANVTDTQDATVYRYTSADATWYEVDSVTDDDNFEITVAYSGDTIQDEGGETIAQDVSATITNLESNAGYYYSPTYLSGVKLYVHCSDSLEATGRVYGNRYGYKWKLGSLSWITFLNLTYKHTNAWGMSDSTVESHMRWQGCELAYAEQAVIQIWDDCDYMEVIDCDISYAQNGIYNISGSIDAPSNYIFRGNTIHDIALLDKIAIQGGDAHAIGVQGGTNGLVEDNIIYHCGSGIVYWAAANVTGQEMKDVTIRNNKIWDISTAQAASGYGISVSCNSGSLTDKSGIKIYGNIVSDSDIAGRFNIEDEMLICNNVFANSTTGLNSDRLYEGIGANLIVKNNIFYNNSSYHVKLSANATTYVYDFDYNSYYPAGANELWRSYAQNGDTLMTLAQWQAEEGTVGSTFDTNSIDDEPELVGPLRNKFAPKTSGSPVVGAGTTTPVSGQADSCGGLFSDNIGALVYQQFLLF